MVYNQTVILSINFLLVIILINTPINQLPSNVIHMARPSYLKEG